MPACPNLEHRRVFLGHDRAHVRGAQRRDRHRASVVRIVFVHLPGVEQPHPRRQLRLDVQDVLTSGDQLLR
jgi:hypothetical protein